MLLHLGQERMKTHSMHIYQKTTFSSRMKSRSHLGQLAFFAEAGSSSYEKLGLDPTLILRLTEGECGGLKRFSLFRLLCSNAWLGDTWRYYLEAWPYRRRCGLLRGSLSLSGAGFVVLNV